jgi:hypothetical protein
MGKQIGTPVEWSIWNWLGGSGTTSTGVKA